MMADSKLVDNVILTIIARLAIVLATGVGLPGAFWMMNRAVTSVDVISAKIDALKEQGIETAGAVKLVQQTQAAQGRTIDDHEMRLRKVESINRVSREN